MSPLQNDYACNYPPRTQIFVRFALRISISEILAFENLPSWEIGVWDHFWHDPMTRSQQNRISSEWGTYLFRKKNNAFALHLWLLLLSEQISYFSKKKMQFFRKREIQWKSLLLSIFCVTFLCLYVLFVHIKCLKIYVGIWECKKKRIQLNFMLIFSVENLVVISAHGYYYY